MIEIIPNWHPIFVHFAIGLLSISALFHVVAAINNKSTSYYQFESVANWNLWLGALLALATITSGWFAYNSVDHDTPSHLAMTDHRNWALGTTGLFVVLAIWSFQRARKSIPIGWAFAILMLVASGLLATTGWKGGELVYRHGLGVMSLPDKKEHDHASHDHGDDAGHAEKHSHDSLDASGAMPDSESAAEVGEVDHGHDHAHDSIDSAEKPDQTDSDNTNLSKEETKKAGDGHTHDHDHGDHKH